MIGLPLWQKATLRLLATKSKQRLLLSTTVAKQKDLRCCSIMPGIPFTLESNTMSKHVWLQKTMGEVPLREGIAAFNLVSKYRVSNESYCFVGYVLETMRQKTYRDGAGKYGELQYVCLENIWQGVCKSRHKYAKGKNASNYIAAGMLWKHYLLESLAKGIVPAKDFKSWQDCIVAILTQELGLSSNTPVWVVADALEGRSRDLEANLLRNPI